MERDNTTLKNKKEFPLTERQKELLRKEKTREDFDDRFIPMLTASLKKDGLKYGYACNFEQTKQSSIFNRNQIVIYNENGEYCTF